MDYVKLRTHVVDHVRFLEVGPQARDLWHWGMLYAGRHETDGELPMAAVMASSWGRGGRANVMVATKLVEAGLWERTESGWRVLRWEEQGNLTRSQISSAREAARERMKKRRSSDPPVVCSREQPANFARSSLGVPTSTSTSTSTSESGSDPRSKRSQVGSAEPAPEPVTEVRTRRKPETPCPASDATPEAVDAWAAGWKIPTADPEFTRFLDHHRKSDARWRDWAAAWRTWQRNAPRFAPRSQVPLRHVQSADNRAWKMPPEMP